mmetsp:Transcript_28042/g.91413  ORF Transcript_28042/g.91413 Transcript_28042/m.91413 type:complete len:250 (-) Transcript_28042:364-1113(-)
MPQQPLHVLWHGAVKVHADRPAREDERRELRVAQHARRVPRVAAVQPEGHDSLLVGRGERVDAHHLLHQRQPARRQPRRIGGERSAHALYSVPPLPHPRRRHGARGLPPFRVPAQHRAKAQVDVAAARHVVQEAILRVRAARRAAALYCERGAGEGECAGGPGARGDPALLVARADARLEERREDVDAGEEQRSAHGRQLQQSHRVELRARAAPHAELRGGYPKADALTAATAVRIPVRTAATAAVRCS